MARYHGRNSSQITTAFFQDADSLDFLQFTDIFFSWQQSQRHWIAVDFSIAFVNGNGHLHGGVGVDRDYPVHRCYIYARQLELTLGGGAQQLRAIGKLLADEPAPAG